MLIASVIWHLRERLGLGNDLIYLLLLQYLTILPTLCYRVDNFGHRVVHTKGDWDQEKIAE